MERVILDTIPGVDPVGTCPYCRETKPLNLNRLRTHDRSLS